MTFRRGAAESCAWVAAFVIAGLLYSLAFRYLGWLGLLALLAALAFIFAAALIVGARADRMDGASAAWGESRRAGAKNRWGRDLPTVLHHRALAAATRSLRRRERGAVYHVPSTWLPKVISESDAGAERSRTSVDLVGRATARRRSRHHGEAADVRQRR